MSSKKENTNNILKKLQEENNELRIRLAEAEETLDAIRSGAVDAIVAAGPEGDQVFTLKGADAPYRLLVDTMNEGAVTIAADHTIMYCNGRMAELLNTSCNKIAEKIIDEFIYKDDLAIFNFILSKKFDAKQSDELRLCTESGKIIPVLVSYNHLSLDGIGHCLIFTELTELKKAQEQLKKTNENLEELVVRRTVELKESQKTYKELVSNARSIIIKMDTEGRFIFINEYGQEFFGFTKEEFLGKSKLDTIVPRIESTGRDLNELLDNIINDPDKYSININENIKKNGERVWVEWHNKALFDNEGKRIGLISVGIDITERKQSEDNLRFHSSILEVVNDAIIGTDLSFNINYWNSAAEFIYGWKAGEVMGKSVKDVLQLQISEDQYSVYLKHLTSDHPVPTETVHLTKDNQRRIISGYAIPLKDARRMVTGYVSINNDITERKQAEEKLKESEARFRSVLDNSQDVIYRLNIQTGRYDYISPSAEAVVGYSPEEFMAMDVESSLSMIHPDDLPVFKMAQEQLQLEGKAQAEYRQRTKNGEYRWISNNISISKDCDGKPLYRNGNIHDITKRKKTEEELQKYTETLKELNATKDKFFRIIAHDLRNPFTSLLGVSDMMIDNAEKYNAERIRKMATLMNNSAKNVYTLLENLLEWSRSQTGNIKILPEKFKLCEVVDGIISVLTQNAADKEIILMSEIENGFAAYADKNITNTIIRNLVSNAIKFTHKGGMVTVNAIKNENHVTVSVKDTGIGLSKEEIDKLFKIDIKFTKAGTDRESGTGLGLILCKEFVEKLGGRIWVESEPGKGSEFKFTIPNPN